MALLANVNRGKHDRPLPADHFNPYRERTPAKIADLRSVFESAPKKKRG